MSYIEIKTIKGRRYKYERKSYRVNGKVKHTSRYIGPVEPLRKRKKGQGRKPSIFVRSLTSHEISELRKAKRSTGSFRRDRAHIILQSNQGKSVNQICKNLSRNRKTVVRAIKAFNKKGLKALERSKAKGAKPRFTKEQRAKILQILMTDPRELGLHFTTWSLPRLKKYLIETGVVDYICIESIRNVIKSQGTTYRKSKRRQYSNDADFFLKNYG